MGYSVIDVTEWAQNARPGDKIVYATRSCSSQTARPAAAMELAYSAHACGLVFLSQRSDGAGGYLYQATRISPRTARFLRIHPSQNR